MADYMDRKDAAPWQKVRTIQVLKSLLNGGDTLSASLRNTKYSPVGGRVKKPAVDWMCAGLQLPHTRSFPPRAETFSMELKSRLIVNHSGGVMENAGLALHRSFSTPLIPGSAVKGIARHAAWCDWKDTDEEEDKELYADFIVEIFGYPTGDKGLDLALKNRAESRSGAVAFLSGEAEQGGMLESDILNGHENNKPIPIFFPAVAAKTVFSFALIPLRISTTTDMDTLMYFAADWLKKGLRDFGAGSKTNAGYGWLEEVADV